MTDGFEPPPDPANADVEQPTDGASMTWDIGEFATAPTMVRVAPAGGSMTAYDRVVTALRDTVPSVRANGTSAVANCPAHHDQHPSLGVTWIEGSVLLNCRSQQCAIDDILAALRLTKADLYDEPAGATYRYDDGRVVHRTPDKRFRQSGATKGTGQLYRLAKVEQAVADGQTVHVVEGEKDVHAIESAGGVATCSPMGAGKARKADWSPLRGGDVVIVADKDEAGRRHAADVAEILHGEAASVRTVVAMGGKDAADHVAAGHNLDELVPADTSPATAPLPDDPETRTLRLTRASDILIRPVHWLWAGRIALGTLALLGGREGIGKSTCAYALAADITRGRLPGRHEGQPRNVVVAASEDSWEHTIVPRLMAAGADLDRVYRVDIVTYTGLHTEMSLPRDLIALRAAVADLDVVLILLDPLMSRLDAKLDTHKDAEVRMALEPLVHVADETGAAIIGLIHVNKSSSTDPLTTLMASRAFAAVARAVLFAIADPDDETIRYLGQPKNNLGRIDLPTLTFRIDNAFAADTDQGPVFTGRLNWVGETDRTIREILESAGEAAETRTAIGDAGAWLADYLASVGGRAAYKAIKDESARAGHAIATVKRARKKHGIVIESAGYPRQTTWSLTPETSQPVRPASGESELTDLTDLTDLTESPVGSVSSVSPAPARTCADCYDPIPAHHTRCDDCTRAFIEEHKP